MYLLCHQMQFNDQLLIVILKCGFYTRMKIIWFEILLEWKLLKRSTSKCNVKGFPCVHDNYYMYERFNTQLNYCHFHVNFTVWSCIHNLTISTISKVKAIYEKKNQLISPPYKMFVRIFSETYTMNGFEHCSLYALIQY